MPLPNYGYFNKEEKKHQELLFEMAPEVIDYDEQDRSSRFNPNARESSNLNKKRAQVTTGKLGIDLERKIVIHDEKDPDVWKAPQVDKSELQEAKKYASQERKDFRRQVRSSIDSLISGQKARELRDGEAKKKPSDLGIILGSSGGSSISSFDSSSPPTPPARKRFTTPPKKTSYQPIQTEISLRTSSPIRDDFGNNGYAQEKSSYFAASSVTSSYSSSSSSYKKPTVNDFRQSSKSESWQQQKSSVGVATPSQRIIPVRRQ